MSEVKELTDAEFATTVNSTEVPVLVDFSASWCQPCKALAPTIDAVAKEYEGRLAVYKVDVDQARDTAVNYQIRGVPTCVFLKSGEEVDRFQGNLDLRQVKERVDKVVG